MNDSTSPSPVMSNKVYDILKYITQIVLPAVGALYFALASVWHLPNGTEVVGTITVVDTFLGVVLGLTTKAYNNSDAKFDGAIEVSAPANSAKVFSLELNTDPQLLDEKDQVIFKVNKTDPVVDGV